MVSASPGQQSQLTGPRDPCSRRRDRGWGGKVLAKVACESRGSLAPGGREKAHPDRPGECGSGRGVAGGWVLSYFPLPGLFPFHWGKGTAELGGAGTLAEHYAVPGT